MKQTRTLGTMMLLFVVTLSELEAKEVKESLSSSASVGDNPGALSSSSTTATPVIQKPKGKTKELEAPKNKTVESEVKETVDDEEKVKEVAEDKKNETDSLSDTADESNKEKRKKKGEEKESSKNKSSDTSDPENADISLEQATNPEENPQSENVDDSGDDGPDVAPLKEKTTTTEKNVKKSENTKSENNKAADEQVQEDITKTPVVETPAVQTTTKAPPVTEETPLIKEIYNDKSVSPGGDVEATESNFLGYLIVLSILTIVAYLVFHNKKKILGLIVEGRSRRQPGRRRSGGREYRKLDSNVEDMMETGKETSMRQVIY